MFEYFRKNRAIRDSTKTITSQLPLKSGIRVVTTVSNDSAPHLDILQPEMLMQTVTSNPHTVSCIALLS